MHDEIKLCFFSHAGSSARSYAAFKKFLDPCIKPVPVEIAGRGSRLSEPRFTDPYKCAEDVFNLNREIFEQGNYAFFGHSLGTILSYEVAKLIKKNGLPSPLHLFLSSRSAPQDEVDSNLAGAPNLSDEDFIKVFTNYGGLPASLANNSEMMNLILPILRDDVKMADSYRPVITEPEIDSDITVCYGRGDRVYSGENVELWQACTTGKMNVLPFDGDHFYYNYPENRTVLCDYISKTLVGY